ncbi:MAG: hypothetical protein U0Z70_15560 [Thermomicrobiales bacterium]
MQAPTAAAGVVEHLRGRILSGALQPETALPPGRVVEFRCALGVSPDRADVFLTLHQPVLDAIRAQDPAAARRPLHTHADHLTADFAAQGRSDHPLVTGAGTRHTHAGDTFGAGGR